MLNRIVLSWNSLTQLPTTLLLPLTLILLGASRFTWKSADPVQMRTVVILLGEEGCVVAGEVMRAVQEAARSGAVFLVVDEEATYHKEAVAKRRLHDLLVKHPKRPEPSNC